MSFNSYSKALYELSVESNVTDEIERQSKSILKALETIKEFNAFIKNPLFKKIDHDEVVVYDKDDASSISSAEKISKNNSITVLYLEGGIQSWTENNFTLIEGS